MGPTGRLAVTKTNIKDTSTRWHFNFFRFFWDTKFAVFMYGWSVKEIFSTDEWGQAGKGQDTMVGGVSPLNASSRLSGRTLKLMLWLNLLSLLGTKTLISEPLPLWRFSFAPSTLPDMLQGYLSKCLRGVGFFFHLFHIWLAKKETPPPWGFSQVLRKKEFNWKPDPNKSTFQHSGPSTDTKVYWA